MLGNVTRGIFNHTNTNVTKLLGAPQRFARDAIVLGNRNRVPVSDAKRNIRNIHRHLTFWFRLISLNLFLLKNYSATIVRAAQLACRRCRKQDAAKAKKDRFGGPVSVQALAITRDKWLMQAFGQPLQKWHHSGSATPGQNRVGVFKHMRIDFLEYS